ncbi:sulfotransferase 6B1-like [Varanus komodoensis]|uniref:Sulfotransferase n=1 Tax=Varanus komodoensis TaxID=61221 RepID=A0A8D2IRL7_VARKO|nr:sulfotransferase 6B1-like [Varanus komodoensis]
MTKNRKHAVEFLNTILTDGAKLAPEEKLFSYKGILYPVTFCSPETFEALETFEAREDDVILAGYPKTGTNWLDQILCSLETTAAKYTEEEIAKRIALEGELGKPMRLEFGNADVFRRMAKLPSRRILITHLTPRLLPPSIFNKKAKILVLIRNPKDTVVSYFHFINKMSFFPTSTWDAYFTDFMNGKVGWGSYFDQLKEWDKYVDDETVMGISYEELKEDLNLGLKKIAKFFGFSLSEEEFQSVAEKSTFQAMKEKAHESHGTFGDALFRKGSVGDWKSLFTEAQNQAMDQKFEECLASTKLGAKLKYEVYCKI